MAGLLVVVFLLGQAQRSFSQSNPPVSLSISRLGNNAVIHWLLSSNDYQLETKSVLDPALSWSPVLATAFLNSSNFYVTNPIAGPRQFYRLHGEPARILIQPAGNTNVPGAIFQLSVVPSGTPPFLFQWRLNGESLLAETNSFLVITNLQLVNCGSYEVVVANDVSSTLSQPAIVKLTGEETVFSDDFGGYPPRADLSGSLNGSNVGATKEAGEPAHAGRAGGKSVWFTWMPVESGIATFDTVGSAFDTLLAVYTGTVVSNLTPVVSDDDGEDFYRSTVKFNAIAGTTYEIAMDGFAAASGNLVLNWNEEVTPDTVPSILTQPQSQSVPPTHSATFNVVAIGQPPLTDLFYQWQLNGLDVTNAHGSNYTIAAVQIQDLGDYRVIVSNSAGRSVISAVASLQTATAQAGSDTNAFLIDKLEELFDNSGTNGFLFFKGLPQIKPRIVSVSAGTLITIISGTGGLTQSAETMTCAKINTGTLYVDLKVTDIGKTLTVDTLLSTANTALKLRLPNLSSICNDNVSTTILQSQVITTPTSVGTYRVTIGTVKGSPAGTVQLNVLVQ